MIPPTKAVLDEPEAETPDGADAPMTGDQADLLQALCQEAGEPYDGNLTQIEAVERIEALRQTLNRDQNL